MNKKKISVVINTYNAERHLLQVLDSVKDFDEVLICDMESTDGTVAIAHKNGCRVISFPKGELNIVEPARDYAIHQTSYPWVLVVDADELVPAELKDYLYAFINENNDVCGLRISRKNYFWGRFMHGAYPDPNLRFFQKEKTTWPNRIHTQPKVDGAVIPISSHRKELALIHLANESISQRVEKINRYTENEIPKREGRTYSWFAFIHRPCIRFLKCYILKGGFKDGLAGFVYAGLEGFYQFIMVAKLREK